MSELLPCKLCGIVPVHRADGLIAHGTWNSECPLWESSWMLPEDWTKLMGQGEPVAWKYTTNGANVWFSAVKPPEDAYGAGTLIPLFAAPPQAQGDDWIPLSFKAPDCLEVRVKLTDGSEINCWSQSDGDFYWKSGSGEMFICEQDVTHWKPQT